MIKLSSEEREMVKACVLATVSGIACNNLDRFADGGVKKGINTGLEMVIQMRDLQKDMETYD